MEHQEHAIAAEWIERQALEDFYRAAPETAKARLGLARHDLGGAALFVARNEPGPLFNRAIGLGIHQPVSEDDVIAIRDHYATEGVADYLVHVQPWVRPAKTWNWLFAAGLARTRGWTQFVRDTAPAVPAQTSLRVVRIGREHALDFARIAAAGFELSDATIPVLAAMVGLPGWYHFMSFHGDRPAGVGAMRVGKGVAWLDWGATHPELRGQGSQSALLAERVRTAIELGCRNLYSETGEAVPGDPQHSFCNLVRAGFTPSHTRDNFAPCRQADKDGRTP